MPPNEAESDAISPAGPRVLALAVAVCVAGATAAAARGSRASLQDRAAAIAAQFEASAGFVAGVSAVDLETGQAVVAVRDREPFLPASNQKLLTSAFALERLGAGFRFRTGVFRVGQDLLVVGDGDPTLGDPRLAAERRRSIYAELDRWSAAVRRALGPRVRHVLLCTQPLSSYRHPDWPERQRQAWHCAPVAELNFHDNCVDVVFRQAGGRIVPAFQPAARHFRVVNRLRRGRNHTWSLRFGDDDATLTFLGTVSRATTDPYSVAVNDPPLLLGRAFAERLLRAGIGVAGQVRKIAPADVPWARTSRVCLTTTPLAVAMRRANKRSLNMAAEAIFLRAGDGTWPGSAKMMAGTLTKSFGLPAGSVRAADGSGLSRRNRVTPAALTKLLAAAAGRNDAAILLASLPIGGVDGSLRTRFRSPPLRGRIVAKTGTLAGVSCLSGFVLDSERRGRFAFAVLVNGIRRGHGPATDLQQAVCSMLIEATAPPPATRPNSRPSSPSRWSASRPSSPSSPARSGR